MSSLIRGLRWAYWDLENWGDYKSWQSQMHLILPRLMGLCEMTGHEGKLSMADSQIELIGLLSRVWMQPICKSSAVAPSRRLRDEASCSRRCCAWSAARTASSNSPTVRPPAEVLANSSTRLLRVLWPMWTTETTSRLDLSKPGHVARSASQANTVLRSAAYRAAYCIVPCGSSTGGKCWAP